MYVDEFSKDELQHLVEESHSFRELALKLGYIKGCSGGTIHAIKKRLEDQSISTEHFGCAPKFHAPCAEEEVFCENSKVSQRTLRDWVLRKKEIKYECAICGQLPVWNNMPLTLILDHINGKNSDNQLSNLRWVCPNCNSQLITTGSRNPNRKVHKKLNFCTDCGKKIYRTSIRCQKCNSIYREKIKHDKKAKGQQK